MLSLVVDTNLFHEFRPIHDLPWEKFGETDEIILVVTEPVQTELDEHKKAPRARIKRRAIEWTSKFRQLILSDQTDLVVRQAGPRVIVRLDGTRPDTKHDDVLDRSVPDDCIVAIAIALQSRLPKTKLAVFSDDLRPLRKARQVSLNAMEIPEDWRREPEQTEEEKVRTKLEQQVAQLRRQEPELVLSTSVETPVESVLPVYEALSDEQIDDLIDAVRQHNPIESRFAKYKPHSSLTNIQKISLGIKRHEFCPAPQEAIDRYIEHDYPDWLETCRERISDSHNFFMMAKCDLRLTIELANHGTRPALDLQIAFKAKGAVGIMPDEEDESSRFIQHVAPLFSLPKAPVAPQGEWKTHDPLDILGDWRMRGFDHLAAHIPRTLDDVLRDQQRDPNCFYYRDNPNEPVSCYSLTCAQFRHADEVERFNVLIRPSGDAPALDGKKAMVEVTCNASNLTSPVTFNFPIRFRCELRSTYDAVREYINSNRSYCVPDDSPHGD